MEDSFVSYLPPTIGSLAMGFVGGAVAWFATNFWGKPISKFLDLRLQAQEAILFHANIGPYLADTERTPKASDDLRSIAAQIGGITATSSPIILWLLRQRGYDLPTATEQLIGLSNTLAEPFGANLSHREKAQKALRLPVVPRSSARDRLLEGEPCSLKSLSQPAASQITNLCREAVAGVRNQLYGSA